MEFLLSLFKNPYFIQGIGFLGTLTVALGMQQRQYNRIVACKITNEIISGFQYLLLGGFTGMAVNFASCVANGVYWLRIRKNKSTLPFQIVFGMMFVVIGCLSWHGWVSIFVILAKLISSVALGINNTRVIRILNLISTPCWLMYNIYMFNIAGMCSDAIMLTSLVIAVIRLDIKKQKTSEPV